MNKILLACLFFLLDVSLVKGTTNPNLESFGDLKFEKGNKASFYRLVNSYYLNYFNGIYPISAHWLITCKRSEGVGSIKLPGSDKWQKVVTCIEHPTFDLCLVQVAEAIEKDKLKKVRLLRGEENLLEANSWVLCSNVNYNPDSERGLLKVSNDKSSNALAAFSQVLLSTENEIYLKKGDSKDFDTWFYSIWREKKINLLDREIKNCENKRTKKEEEFKEKVAKQAESEKENNNNFCKENLINNQEEIDKEWQEYCKNSYENEREIKKQLSVFTETYPEPFSEDEDEDEDILSIFENIKKKFKNWPDQCNGVPYKSDRGGGVFLIEKDEENNDRLILVGLTSSCLSEKKNPEGACCVALNLTSNSVSTWIQETLKNNYRDFKQDLFKEPITKISTPVSSNAIVLNSTMILTSTDFQVSKNGFVRIGSEDHPIEGVLKISNENGLSLLKLVKPIKETFSLIGLNRHKVDFDDLSNKVSTNRDSLGTFELGYSGYNCSLFQLIADRKDGTQEFSIVRVGGSEITPGLAAKIDYSVLSLALGELKLKPIDEDKKTNHKRSSRSASSYGGDLIGYDPDDNKWIEKDNVENEEDKGYETEDNEEIFSITGDINRSAHAPFGKLATLVGPQAVLAGLDSSEYRDKTILIGQEKRKITTVIEFRKDIYLLLLNEPVFISPAVISPWDFKQESSGYVVPSKGQVNSKTPIVDFKPGIGSPWKAYPTKKIFGWDKQNKSLLIRSYEGIEGRSGGAFIKFDSQKKDISSLNGVVLFDSNIYNLLFKKIKHDLNSYNQFVEQIEDLPQKKIKLSEELPERYRSSTFLVQYFDEKDVAGIHYMNLMIALGKEKEIKYDGSDL